MLKLHLLRPIAAVVISIILSTSAAAVSKSQNAMPLKVNGEAAVLMDIDTGAVLYSKNAHARLPNASTTKIMTAILIIEHCKMNDRIKASKNASETPYTSLHLKPGETITVKDLLSGMLVRSANDAAVAAAEHIAGSTPKYADMMNRKAREIGCKDTHFVTPNGLYAPGHYSSAYDLCLMAKYALRYREFNEAICARKYYLNSRSMNKKDLCVFSHSRFLRHYPGADGVKSGYTRQAKRCYVGSATRNGWRLVSAVLGSSNASDDTVTLMNYGFGRFQPKLMLSANKKCADAPVKGGWRHTVPACVAKDFRVPVRKSGSAIVTRTVFSNVEAPVAKGDKMGKFITLVDGKQAAAVDIVASEDLGVSFGRRAWNAIKGCGIIVACLIGGKYVTTTSKGTRRRRRRVTSSLRINNRRR